MPMTPTIANVEMAKAWDGQEGEDWTVNAERYEAAGERLSAHLDLSALIRSSDRVLDIGCGTGKATLEAARLASSGSALGVDLSSRMLGHARARAGEEGLGNVEFLQADAQVHPFEPAGFDVAISVFGAMFFNDPGAAFSNIYRALTSGARLSLLAWRPLEENEWLMTIRGALAMGRTLPAPPADGPGPFGLADGERARRILEGAGFVDVRVTAIDEPVYFGSSADDAWTFVRSQGIVRGLTQDLDDDAKQAALDRLRQVVDDHDSNKGVLFDSGAWLITARR